MKTKTQIFFNKLRSLIRKDTDESKRFVQKLEAAPEEAAEKVYHLLGTSTQRLSFKELDENVK